MQAKGPKPRKSGGQARRVAQNFVLFFPSPSVFSSLSGVFSWNFGGVCLKRQGAQMCTFGFSGCGVKPRRFWGGPGEGRSGGTEHDQTRTLKPTPTRETPLHETVKQAPTPHSTHTHHTRHTAHTHTTHNTTPYTTHQTRFGQSRFGQSRPWPVRWRAARRRGLIKSLPPTHTHTSTHTHQHTHTHTNTHQHTQQPASCKVS